VPEIDVATIKPSNPEQQGKLYTVRGRTVMTINTTASDLIGFAYRLHPRQIVGVPEWVTADRFKLTFHREQRELPVYALVVGKDGPKLATSGGDPNGLPSLLFRGLGLLPVINASMTSFAEVMQSAVLDRPVVDRTNLAGRFDFTLRWTPDESQFASMGVRVPPPSGDPNAPPILFTAIQEQLGLRFDSTRAPVEVFAIDQIAKPSAN
jgi:uncharacterized protein (TIGR03435 family)